MKRALQLETWEQLLLLRDKDGRPTVFLLCQLFLDNTPNKLITLQKATLANNNILAATEAGQLKSAAINLGAATFSQLCTAMEGLALAGVVNAGGGAILTQLQAEFVKVVSELQSLLQDAQGKRAFEKTNPKIERPAPIVPTQLKVLIIDDDPFYRTLLTRTVEQIIQGPEVIAIDTYQEAVETLRVSGNPESKPFDLIIADLNLKTGSTGIDVWRIAQVHAKNAAFLLISGSPLDEFIELVGEQTGEVPTYLPKPFRLDHARTMLEWLLKARSKITFV